MSRLWNLIDDRYVWTFPNVQDIWKVRGTSLMSDRFTLKIRSNNQVEYDTDWNIIITEKNKNEIDNCHQGLKTRSTSVKKAEEQYISLYIQNFVSCGFLRESILKLRFAIIHPIEGEVHIKSKMILRVNKNQNYGFSNYITVDQLKELGFQDLTVHCTFEIVRKDIASYKPLLCNHRFSDVKIIIGKETLPAHKVILSMSSSVLRNKFGDQESISSIEINDCEPEIFKEVLRFMYTGTVDNLETLAFGLYIAAFMYKIYGLQTICEKFLITHLNEENILSTFCLCQISGDFNSNSLYEECVDFVARNLKKMITSGVCKALGQNFTHFLRDIVYKYRSNKECSTLKKKAKFEVSIKTETSDYFETFETFLNKKMHSDVTIHIGDKTFYAHKLILCAASPVFRRMFENEMKETISGVVEIKDIDADVFYQVLRFMYTKKVGNIENMATDVLIAANKYDVDDLKVKSANILAKRLTRENASCILLIADSVNAKGLKDECLHFIMDHNILHKLDVHFLFELLNKLAFDQ